MTQQEARGRHWKGREDGGSVIEHESPRLAPRRHTLTPTTQVGERVCARASETVALKGEEEKVCSS